MTKVDNFELIKREILHYDTSDDFYYLMIAQRSKEVKQPKIIKQYILRNGDIDIMHDRIVEYCVKNKARAYINPNRKSFHDCTVKTISELTNCLLNKDYSRVQDKFFSACGQIGSNFIKYWVVDIDTKDENFISEIKGFIDVIEPYDCSCKIKTIIPTVNGVHLITTPFNIQKFSKTYPQIDVHKNNFTLLFYED